MAEHQKSGAQKAARGAQVVGGIIKIATGIASQNYVQAIIGAVEVIPWKKVFTVIGVILLIILLPIIILLSLPQILFGWAFSEHSELIERNEHSTEIVDYYYEASEKQAEGVDPDIDRLICIQAVQTSQNVESVTKDDVDNMFLFSYFVDEETGEVHNKTSEEMMDELNFSEEQRNWVELMYNTITAEKVDTESCIEEDDLSEGYANITLSADSNNDFEYYSQLDDHWKDVSYGKRNTIGISGSAPTVLAMVISNLSTETVTPTEIGKWAEDNGYVLDGSGSYPNIISEGAQYYGLSVEKLHASTEEELRKHISKGNLIIAQMGKGTFASNGNYIVLRGLTEDGKVLIADPTSYKRSILEWDMSTIIAEAKKVYSSGGPFWSVSLPKAE